MPLYWVVLNRYANLIASLLDKGVDINAVDKVAWTLLFWAIVCGYYKVMLLLLERGSDLN